MDVTTMLNQRGVQRAASQPGQQGPQPATHLPQMMAPMGGMPLPGDRPDSPHGSDVSRFSAPPMNHYTGSPTAMNPQIPTSMPPNIPMMVPNPGLAPTLPHQMPQPQPPSQPAKAYPCGTCGKGFARRSDLARHERIHSGVRPHACEFPGCGKRFIQRSALTVHTRVHTGEKPHMCEHCSKTFSDSSSLARHRRIHSGKRPYKCPYADCQKTFTRRTTLTRHQNHHTGSIEEAAAATAATLAANRHQKPRSDDGSNHASPMSTPSPAQRPLSMSPGVDMPGTPGAIQRDFQHLNNPSLPQHVQRELYPNPTPHTAAGFANPVRPTSHPMTYNAPPPQTLEPSADPNHSAPSSVNGSPHLSAVGWQSPQAAHSPSAHSNPSYVYPEPEVYTSNAAANGGLFYNSAATIRRPDSAQSGSGSFHDVKPPRPNEVWAGAH